MSAKTKVFTVRVLARPRDLTPVRQPRLIVAATSRAAAVRAIQAAGHGEVTDGYMKTYGSETGNPQQVEAATSEPGTVFIETGRHTFVPLTGKP